MSKTLTDLLLEMIQQNENKYIEISLGYITDSKNNYFFKRKFIKKVKKCEKLLIKEFENASTKLFQSNLGELIGLKKSFINAKKHQDMNTYSDLSKKYELIYHPLSDERVTSDSYRYYFDNYRNNHIYESMENNQDSFLIMKEPYMEHSFYVSHTYLLGSVVYVFPNGIQIVYNNEIFNFIIENKKFILSTYDNIIKGYSLEDSTFKHIEMARKREKNE